MQLNINGNGISKQSKYHERNPQSRHGYLESTSNTGSEGNSGLGTQECIEKRVETVTPDNKTIKERAGKIVSLLPKENCGKCGFPNCGTFAVAAARMEASAFGCHKEPSSGYKISEITGVKVSEAVSENELVFRGHHHGKHGCVKHGHLHHHGHGNHNCGRD
jgi:hypothetical protein